MKQPCALSHTQSPFGAALSLLLVLFLAGCGNDPNPKPFAEKTPDGRPWTAFYWYMSDDVRSLDPQVAYDQASRRVLEPIQDTLLEYHPMKLDPYEVVPCLLEAIPERVANPDGTATYTCRLKKGILFHDDPCFPGGKGREVVAADVHFTFQRLSDPAVESPVFNALAEYVVGMKEAFAEAEKNGGKLNYDTMKVRGIEVIDTHQFKIQLSKPYPQLNYWLAMHFTTPVAREGVEYYDGKEHPDGPNGRMVTRPLFKFHPVGNGAFKRVEWVRGQRHRLIRNENYRTMTFPTEGWPPEQEAVCRPFAGKRLPLADEANLTVFRELLPMWLLARQGYLDRIALQKDAANSVITTSSELSQKFRDRGMKLDQIVEVSTFYLSINMQDPVLGPNKKLRQALSCAYNAQGYSDMLYGGVAPVAQQLLSPGIYGHRKDFKNPNGFNLQRARQLIAEAGYPGGRDPKTGQPLEITLDTVASGGEERQLAEYEQRQLEQLGIKVRVVENTFARMLEKEDQGNFQIAAGTGWGADYPDPENYFFLFYGKNFPPQGKNINRYNNQEFNDLFDKMATMDNSPERLAMVHRMSDILADECPFILNFHKAYHFVVQPWAPLVHKNTTLMEGGLKYLPADPVVRELKRREWNPIARWPAFVVFGVVVAAGVYGVRLNRKRNV